MKKKDALIFTLLVFLAGTGAAGFYFYRKSHQMVNGRQAHTGKYYCPMHPSYTSDSPGDCPICNMSLVAMEQEVPTTASGDASISISLERKRLIGMKSEPLRRRALFSTVRASGRVAYDPDLYHALAEYREAVRARINVKDSSWPDVHERAESLVRASTLKLRQMGFSDEQIEEAGKSDHPPTNLILGGGGDAVWVYAQIYEYEIGMVKPGQLAQITSPAFRGRKFQGVLKAVDPMLSAETRALRVRIEAPNPDNLLKLEMYVNVAIEVNLGVKLALPEGALMDTGERQIIFVDLGEGNIGSREVRIGREADGFFELLSGAKEGEKVVTSANFLIDSESKLRAAIGKSQTPAETKSATNHAGPEHRH